MKNAERWVALFDNHGNLAVPSVVDVAFGFIRDFKPTFKIHGGDAFNFACLRKGADDDEQREKLKDDVDAGIAFMKRLKPNLWLRGNHDERLWDAAASDDGKLNDLAGYIILDIEEAVGKIPILRYDAKEGVYRYGDHNLLHGYHGGMYAARAAAAVYGNCIMGHVHADDHMSSPRVDEAVGHTSGCLCQLRQRYNRAHANTVRQCHGFLYGFRRRDTVVVYHAKPHNGVWYFPTEFREVAA